MLNFKMLYKVLGALLFIEAAMQLLCLAVSFVYREDDFFAFEVSLLLTIIGATLLRYFGRENDNTLSRRDAYVVVTFAWVMFSLFGTLPFMLSGYITNFTDAFFESMSGFTTTGASVLESVEVLPHGLLFWRSLMQWIGGLGIVFFTIALLPSMTGGSVRVFAAEATGPIKTKLHPRLSMSAKWIWMIYLVLTLSCIGSYYLFGMTGFDAINYGMTTTATGGFGTHDMSTEFFNSPPLEYITIAFCFMSGVNFILLWTSLTRFRLSRLFQNTEFKVYVFLIVVCTAFIMTELIMRNGYDFEHAFRSSLFSVVSFITTTGLFNDDAGKWPHVTWIVLTVLMFLGGMSGSTSGGLKCIRGIMLWRMVKNEFRQLLHPNAVLPVQVDGNNISQQRRNSLVALLSIYLILFIISSFVLAAGGVDSTNAITISVSCLSNVGPTLGIEIGPTMSWGELPIYAKWTCMSLMLMGRLEIFTVMVIFTPAFWREN